MLSGGNRRLPRPEVQIRLHEAVSRRHDRTDASLLLPCRRLDPRRVWWRKARSASCDDAPGRGAADGIERARNPTAELCNDVEPRNAVEPRVELRDDRVIFVVSSH